MLCASIPMNIIRKLSWNTEICVQLIWNCQYFYFFLPLVKEEEGILSYNLPPVEGYREEAVVAYTHHEDSFTYRIQIVDQFPNSML